MTIQIDKRKPIYGVGINDADYVTQEVIYYFVNGKRKQKRGWCCPYYQKWVSMLARCYSGKRSEWTPTYSECRVCDEWVYFSNFRVWMVEQDWEGKSLDKDILLPDNKVYSPETCCFITQRVNMFVVKKSSHRDLPTGVTRNGSKFVAKTKLTDGTYKYLGSFSSAEEAHTAWKACKTELLGCIAGEISDKRILNALYERYI